MTGLNLFVGVFALAALGVPTDSVWMESHLTRLGEEADSLYEAADYVDALDLSLDGLRIARSRAPEAPGRVTSWLLRAGRNQLKLSRLDQADSLIREALTEENRIGGEERLEKLEVYRLIRWLESELGDYPKALDRALECVALSRRIRGENDPEISDDLIVVSTILAELDRNEEAMAVLDSVAILLEGTADEEPQRSAGLKTSRAGILRKLGRLEDALSLMHEAVELTERAYGKDHPEVAFVLIELAEIYQIQGQLDTAESVLRRAQTILEVTFGAEHPRLGVVWNNLGVILRRKGDYAAARDAYRRSLAARIAGYGENHPAVALTMINYSALLRSQGAHAESVRLLRDAVSIMEATWGPDHTRTAWALSHLAQEERRIGNAPEAEQIFRKCYEIALAAFGTDHLDVVLYQIGIAQCLRDQGRLEEALALFDQAAETGEKLLGSDSHEVARYRREVGVVLVLLGRFDEGRMVLEKCVRTFEARLGPNHPALNRCLAGLTLVSLHDGNLRRAREYASRNLSMSEAAFGERGLRRSLLMHLAVEVASRDWNASLRIGLRAARIAADTQEDIYQVSSDLDVLRYALHQKRILGALLAACHSAPHLPDSLKAEVFSLVANYHGQVLDRFAHRRQLIELGADPSIARNLYESYLTATERLAELIVRGPRGDPSGFGANVAEARRLKEVSERALAEVSERFRTRLESGVEPVSLTPEQIVSRTENSGGLIQFVRYPVLSIGTVDWRPGATSLDECLFSGGGERYGAFVVRAVSDAKAKLDLIDLGRAATLDQLVLEYRRTVEIVRAGSRPSAREEAEFRSISRRLHDIVWTPLGVAGSSRAGNPELVSTVFLVPTSALYSIDFGTLLAPGNNPLIINWRFHLLSSVRDLFRPYRAGIGKTGLLAVGNPERSRHSRFCGDSARAEAPLPGAGAEAAEVTRLFTGSSGEKGALLIGPMATESAVKSRIQDVRIAHFATHGYFCETAPSAGTDDGRAIDRDPLLSCGLVLATGEEMEDGLLTAQEIVARDLRGLECVVLSACNTGLGTLIPGEGLFGLRRAFEIAGAQTVIMSLWRVGDTAEREMMLEMYRNRIAGHSFTESLRLAQLGRMSEQRRRLHRVHPALWGGIVVEGNWR